MKKLSGAIHVTARGGLRAFFGMSRMNEPLNVQ